MTVIRDALSVGAAASITFIRRQLAAGLVAEGTGRANTVVGQNVFRRSHCFALASGRTVNAALRDAGGVIASGKMASTSTFILRGPARQARSPDGISTIILQRLATAVALRAAGIVAIDYPGRKPDPDVAACGLTAIGRGFTCPALSARGGLIQRTAVAPCRQPSTGLLAGGPDRSGPSTTSDLVIGMGYDVPASLAASAPVLSGPAG